MAEKSASPGRARRPSPRPPLPALKPGEVRLLSGGNPQIPKGYGQEPVDAYLAAMPGWKAAIGTAIDAIVTRTVPGVLKAVKWNTPIYGTEPDRYFMGFHCMTRYVKLAFYRGSMLDPLPPGTSRQPFVRYLDIYEQDGINAAQLADWVRQASLQPGEKM